MKIVLDTNVLVSGLLSSQGAPAAVLRSVLAGSASLCFDERILSEYRGVLMRSKFGFNATQVAVLLEFFEATGEPVLTPPLNLSSLPDPADGMFIEVAIAAAADCLVTGNRKHFPAECLRGVRAVTPRALCELLAR